VGQEKDRQTDHYPHGGNNKSGASYSLWLWLRLQQRYDNDADEDCVLLYCTRSFKNSVLQNSKEA